LEKCLVGAALQPSVGMTDLKTYGITNNFIKTTAENPEAPTLGSARCFTGVVPIGIQYFRIWEQNYSPRPRKHRRIISDLKFVQDINKSCCV
jgi:hypothetical protein